MPQAKIKGANTIFGQAPQHLRPFIANDGQAYEMVYNGTGEKNDPKNYSPQLVDNATLRYDEWRRLDDAVVRAGMQRLVGFDDLRRNGLVFPLDNAMGFTVLTYERISEAMEAKVSIDPIERTAGDQVDHETVHLPLPVIYSDYSIGDRILQESRNRGQALDTANATAAARVVAEKLEDMLFGSTALYEHNGAKIHTYLTEPNINTVSMNIAWDDSAKTARTILDDVLEMKQASIDDRHYGPWHLYVPTSYDTVLDEDYEDTGTTATGQSIRERLLSINGIEGISVVDRLAADTVLLVQMTEDVVDLVDGMPIQNVQWSEQGGFVHNFKVMTIQIPRVKSDYNDRSGIVKMTVS